MEVCRDPLGLAKTRIELWGIHAGSIINNILYIAGAEYYHNLIMEKAVKKYTLRGWSEIKDDLRYWLSKTPQQRIETVEFLRRQNYGDSARLQRIVRVVQRS